MKSGVATYHLAVVQGPVGFAGALGAAAPALPLPALQLGLADLEDRGAGGPAGALLAPIRCRTHAYTSTKPKPLVQCAPARAAQSLPGAEQPEREPKRGAAALTALGPAAREGNLQPEGEPGERRRCPAASLPPAAGRALRQVLLSSIAGAVPGAGRWRRLAAPPLPPHRLPGWPRSNAPPGRSEFPFRGGSSFQRLCCQVGRVGGRRGGVALAFRVCPPRGWVPRPPPAPVARPGKGWQVPRSRQLALTSQPPGSLASPPPAPRRVRIPDESVAGLADAGNGPR